MKIKITEKGKSTEVRGGKNLFYEDKPEMEFTEDKTLNKIPRTIYDSNVLKLTPIQKEQIKVMEKGGIFGMGWYHKPVKASRKFNRQFKKWVKKLKKQMKRDKKK